MPFAFQDRSLSKVGVVGSGQIGPDIALHFAKVLADAGVQVVVVDVSQQALDAGKARTEKKIRKGQESGAFKGDMAERMIAALSWTTDYGALSGAELVVEAATENEALKRKIFAQLEATCAPGAILASNSSHLEPEVIFSEAKDKSRTACVHYFFPAERNIVIEVTPGRDTSPAVTRWLLDFYEAIGKLPIEVRSRYGYAIDPVFEGLFLAALSMRDKGLGTSKEIDTVAMKALGLGIGPFTAMNLTGGNPITAVGLDHYTSKINPWFKTPPSLKQAVETKTPWETPGRDEVVEVPPDREKRLGDLLKGAYFGLTSEILDARLATLSDLDIGISTALVVKPPFTSMNEVGLKESLALVEGFAKEFPGFRVPQALRDQAASGKPWPTSSVQEIDADGARVLKIRRPDKLNALNESVFAQLEDAISRAEADPKVKGVVITGFGQKAFVAGADIDMLSRLKTAEEGYANSRLFHRVLDRIENLKKPVVCAYNGLAFGGGNELAMACHVRIARKGLNPLAGQPEPNLGIIPGAGGTQRLPRIVGMEKAWSLLRTGRPFSGKEALEMGLISEEVDGSQLLPRAIAIANGTAGVAIKPIRREALGTPPAVPDVEIGHLSRKIDGILQRAILEGWSLPLDKALDLESRCFGECVETKDMHAGMQTFLTQGARAKAAFTHE
jgi:enoyl-CoA hydratase/3-hydroxyacyl-CoA dehydrogenase